MYFMPASFASCTQSSALNLTGLNCLASCSYSFTGIGVRPVASLRYISASGRGDGGATTEAGKNTPDSLGVVSLYSLRALIERFDRADMPYEARQRPASAFKTAYRFDDYAQLSRVQEWAASPGEGEGS